MSELCVFVLVNFDASGTEKRRGDATVAQCRPRGPLPATLVRSTQMADVSWRTRVARVHY